MSAPPPRRLRAGLAVATVAVTLAVGLGTPAVVYAEATPSPSPTNETIAATPSPTSSTNQSAEASETSPTTSSPTESADTSPSPGADDKSSTSTAEFTTAARAGISDARAEQAAAAAVEEPSSESLAAQAVGPAISLTKRASPTPVSAVGQVITYQFTVTNSGSLPLTNVAITDDLEGLTDITCPGPATLAAGARSICTATLTVTQEWLDFGDIDNSATVFADIVGDDSGEVYVSANDSAHVAVDQQPAIALNASVSPRGTADIGDRLRYQATATNTGNVTLTGARITSSLDALDLDCEPSARTTLAPGDSISCSGSCRVTRADARRGRVSTTLTARAEGPYGDTSTRGDDVTDATRLRVAVTKLPDASDPGLADTGGVGGALPVGLLGATAVAAGVGLLRRVARR